jgi:hypothetical protein
MQVFLKQDIESTGQKKGPTDLAPSNFKSSLLKKK